ncbi:MAG: hypothetical protein CM1200mP41_18740 [Gammaproteobacteria bacterium]|nr:MAG: hypothetical protein CM1200mP41_18740 [Gammaproteobacteria bacterium]
MGLFDLIAGARYGGQHIIQERLCYNELTASVAALKDRGVRFLVCANTLRGKKVDHENDLYDVVEGYCC